MDNVPIVFKIDRRDDTGYGMMISKGLDSSQVFLRKDDPYESRTIRLDFNQLLNMLTELKTAEKKEMNQRVLLGIEND